jgi:hypothetical protein
MTQPGQFNDKPYRGRRTDSHRASKKKSSGKATFGQTVLAGFIFLALPIGVIAGIIYGLMNGYGVF